MGNKCAEINVKTHSETMSCIVSYSSGLIDDKTTERTMDYAAHHVVLNSKLCEH